MDTGKNFVNGSTEKTFFMQRVLWSAWEKDDNFEKLLLIFMNNRGAVDEVSFFTESDGMDFRYVPIEEARRRAEILSRRIARVKNEGFHASINVLNTIGLPITRSITA